MKESTPNKKLVLIYLANEITQTSKMRKKEEFLRAYEPIMAEATSAAYRGSPAEIQNKIRRVVEVWRSRQIFSLNIQSDIEKHIDGMRRFAIQAQSCDTNTMQNLIAQSQHANPLLVAPSSPPHLFHLNSHPLLLLQHPFRKLI